MAQTSVQNTTQPVLDYLGFPCDFTAAVSRCEQDGFGEDFNLARKRSVPELKRTIARGLEELDARAETAGGLLDAAAETLPNSGDDDMARAVITAAQAFGLETANKFFDLAMVIVAALERLEEASNG